MLCACVSADSWCSWCQLVTCVPMDRWFTWMPFNCNNDVSLCLGANSTDCDPPPCLQCPDQRILSTVSLGLAPQWMYLTLLTKRAMYFTPTHNPVCVRYPSILIRCAYCLLSPLQEGAGQCDGEGVGSTCPTSLCLQLCT